MSRPFENRCSILQDHSVLDDVSSGSRGGGDDNDNDGDGDDVVRTLTMRRNPDSVGVWEKWDSDPGTASLHYPHKGEDALHPTTANLDIVIACKHIRCPLISRDDKVLASRNAVY